MKTLHNNDEIIIGDVIAGADVGSLIGNLSKDMVWVDRSHTS